MAKEPDNLVLELLRNMREEIRGLRDEFKDLRDNVREDIRGVRNVQDMHTLRFADMEDRIDMLRGSTMTALGFATHADMKQKNSEKQLHDLIKRVEKLEKAK